MDQKNFIVAIVLSVLIIVGWQAYFQPTKPPINSASQQQTTTQPGTSGTPQTPAGQPGAPGAQPGAPAAHAAGARGKRVRLPGDTGRGLIFALDITIDDYFMFDVKQSVENKTDKPVTLFPWSLVVRYGQPKAEGIYILHEGPYGVFNGSLKEFGYSDFKDNKQQKFATTGGWVGITDKYWMTTLVPDQQSKVDVSIKQTGTQADPKYQIDYTSPRMTIPPRPTSTRTSPLFPPPHTLP